MSIDSAEIFAIKNCFNNYKHIESVLIFGDLKPSLKKVTIAIPTFKRLELFRDALESAVNQEGFDDYEILILDNEPDFDKETETERVIKSFRRDNIRYYRNKENIGMFGNWNRCFELARGEWVTLLHDDDYYFPNYLQEMVKIIDLNPHIQGITSFQNFWYDDGSKHIRDNWVRNQKKNKYEIFKLNLLDMVFSNRISAANTMYRRKNILELGGYNPNFYPTADYLLNAKYINEFKNVYLFKSILSVYRILENDSLKKNVQEKIIRNDFYLRLAIASKIGLPIRPTKIMVGKLAAKAIKKNGIDSMNDFEELNKNKSFIYFVNIPIAKVIEIFAEYSFKLRSLQAKIISFLTKR